MSSINVKVELLTTSQPLLLKAKNTYTKDGLFCVYLDGGQVQKFPVSNLFRVTEDYRAQDA